MPLFKTRKRREAVLPRYGRTTLLSFMRSYLKMRISGIVPSFFSMLVNYLICVRTMSVYLPAKPANAPVDFGNTDNKIPDPGVKVTVVKSLSQ